MASSFMWQYQVEEVNKKIELINHNFERIPFARGDLTNLPKDVQNFIMHWVDVCKPISIYICDGSKTDVETIKSQLEEMGVIRKLKKLENCFICKTDPRDVARVESKTFISTEEKHASVPHTADGVNCILGQWMSPTNLNEKMSKLFPGCMTGRMMFVIPFSMGPVGSPFAKYGVQITDSNYVALCMGIMTRVDKNIWSYLEDGNQFVKCVHSLGAPLPANRNPCWPCNPDELIISHLPDIRTVISFGSGYGGNSLLAKKCFALRIAGCIGRDEGWLAEHMLIMSVTNPEGEEKFIAAAFPSACGKTNLAMLEPSLPGWKVRTLGDDIAWMRFNESGELRAFNPEAGLFGVAPGTNKKTNPNAMQTFRRNSIFTNVAETEDGSYFWEGLEGELDPKMGVTSWLGYPMTVGQKDKLHRAAHPNSRFCCPIRQCPIIHPKWEDPEGVPICALIFGGRRPEGVPLVYEANSWAHGVMIGACMKSESTAAAEHFGKQIMHDPMAMRPFVGYNFGKYLEHWLSMDKPERKMPKIFHVNWFRLDDKGKFLWPGFAENIRVIDWICRRIDDEDITTECAIGKLPKEGSLNTSGLKVSWEKLFSLPKAFWEEEIRECHQFLTEQVGCDLPSSIVDELNAQEERIASM